MNEKLRKLLQPVVEELGYDFIDVEFIKEGSDWILRIYIDKDGGVFIDDCQRASEKISDILDREDPIKHSYNLEVSSPGVDRPLVTERDFQRYRGKRVIVTLKEAVGTAKTFEGNLEGLIEEKIIIDTGKKKYEFAKEDVALVKRTISFK